MSLAVELKVARGLVVLARGRSDLHIEAIATSAVKELEKRGAR